MLNAVLLFFHVMACLTLVLVILLQVGRGHGLTGSTFSQSGVQTVFGTKTGDFFSKATSVMAIIFMLTCISLDVMHSRRSRSLFGPDQGKTAQVDMEKLKQVLEKIKAEKAATGKEAPAMSQAVDAVTEAASQTAAPVAAQPVTQPSAPAEEKTPAPSAQGG